MDLKLVESVSIRRIKDELSDLLRQAEAGAQFLIMRRLEPAGALISHVERLWKHYSVAVSILSPSNLYPCRFAVIEKAIADWREADSLPARI